MQSKQWFWAYYLFIFFGAITIFAHYLTQPFIVTANALVLICIGCVIEYFVVEIEELRKFSIGTITISLVILFFNIQTLIIAVSLMVLCTAFSRQHTKESILERLSNRDSIYNWAQTIVVGFVLMIIKEFLNLNFTEDINYLKILLILFLYMFTEKTLKIIYHRFSDKKSSFISDNSLFYFYTILAAFFTSYSYYDRGLFITIIIYIFVIPFQKISTLYVLYKKEEAQANKDDLTGVYNGRYLKNTLLQKIKLEEPFSLIMLDLDKFKLVNDTYGHLAGDEALKRFSATIKSAVREKDVVARYGGDEFCIIVNNPKESNALIKRLEVVLKDIPVEFEDYKFSISSSFGVHHYDGEVTDIDFIIGKADNALYECKQNRKNQQSYNAL